MVGKYVYLESYLSRRIGVSTGVNIIGPPKTCTFNCVYCEIGLTSPSCHVSPSDRWSGEFNEEEYTQEIQAALEENPHLNSLTFGYYGEPTLSIHILKAFSIAKRLKQQQGRSDGGPTLTLLSNSTTFRSLEIRNIAAQFDWVVAKLDCAIQKTYESINRPHPSTPPICDIIDFLKKMRTEMANQKHRLSIQTLLLESSRLDILSNIDEPNLNALCQAYSQIMPYSIQIYSLSRDPPESGIHAIYGDKKREIQRFFEKKLSPSLSWRLY
jgi:wyosine [tRNA(Phe)-imidazoG37] synthetase (radical SAM superfamily)